MKAISCGWGGKLHILNGASLKIVGLKLLANAQYPQISNNWNVDGSAGDGSVFGGKIGRAHV